MAKVAVIVPNYQHAPYLSRRIETILSQNFKDFEVLILDDDSKDDSRYIIEHYRTRSKINIIYNSSNSGSVCAQWEKGIRMTDSEYVWIAESDDWADPMLLETLVRRLDDNLGLALAYAQSWIVNSLSEVIGNAICWTRDLEKKRWDTDFIAGGRDELRKYMIRKNTIPNASAVVQRREFVEQCVPLRSDFKLCGDWHHWSRMLALGGVAFVAEPLNFWRSSSSNVRVRPPGVLEWLEGKEVLELIGGLINLSSEELNAAKLAFLEQCWEWLCEYNSSTEQRSKEVDGA